jgi:RNA polymerase sigma-70 factor (ECF subfamily)
VSTDSESKLIQLAIAGDTAAISALYERHVDAIYRYVAYRVNDPRAAEDITADVFLRALAGLDQYDERGLPFTAWLYRISHARVVDHWRAANRHPTVPLDTLSEQEMWSDDSALAVDVLQHRALHEALRTITGEQQEVLALKFAQGLSNEEISQIVNKTVGAVKALQHRGLAALARLLKE